MKSKNTFALYHSLVLCIFQAAVKLFHKANAEVWPEGTAKLWDCNDLSLTFLFVNIHDC